MGIQIHSAKEYRTAVKLVHDGVIGKIVEAHSFSSKRWGDENPKPTKKDPIPEGFDWDAWIGPAPIQIISVNITTRVNGASVGLWYRELSEIWVVIYMTQPLKPSA